MDTKKAALSKGRVCPGNVRELSDPAMSNLLDRIGCRALSADPLGALLAATLREWR
jgi:hypothetical protein